MVLLVCEFGAPSLSESKLGLEEEEGQKVRSENMTMPLSSRREELFLKLQPAAFIGLLFGLWSNG